MLASGFRRSLLQGQDVHPAQELGFILLLVLLCVMAMMASDAFLPALPEMTAAFQASPGLAQLTVTCFILGLGCFQIPYGILSDKWGRKRIILAVFPLFLLSTVGCALASNIFMLLFFRTLQGMAAAAYLVIPRAILTDLFSPLKAQRALLILIPLVSLSPAVAPLIGGVLALYYPWQASFWFVFLLGVCIAALVLLFVPESRSAAVIRVRFSSLQLLNLWSDMRLWRNMITLCLPSVLWWIYLAGAPLLYHQLKYSTQEISLMYAPAVLPYIVTTFISRDLLKRRPPSVILNLGMLFLCFATIPLLFISHFSWLNSGSAILTVITLVSASNGFLVGTSLASAMALYPAHSGLLSGVMGTLQLLASTLGSSIVAWIAADFSPQLFVRCLGVITLCGGALYLFFVYKVSRRK